MVFRLQPDHTRFIYGGVSALCSIVAFALAVLQTSAAFMVFFFVCATVAFGAMAWNIKSYGEAQEEYGFEKGAYEKEKSFTQIVDELKSSFDKHTKNANKLANNQQQELKKIRESFERILEEHDVSTSKRLSDFAKTHTEHLIFHDNMTNKRLAELSKAQESRLNQISSLFNKQLAELRKAQARHMQHLNAINDSTSKQFEEMTKINKRQFSMHEASTAKQIADLADTQKRVKLDIEKLRKLTKEGKAVQSSNMLKLRDRITKELKNQEDSLAKLSSRLKAERIGSKATARRAVKSKTQVKAIVKRPRRRVKKSRARKAEKTNRQRRKSATKPRKNRRH